VVSAHERGGWAVGAVLVMAALLAGCGDDGSAGDDGHASGCRSAEGGQVTVVADDIAWDVDCLEAPAGAPLTIVIDNQDDGVPHNMHVKDAPGGPKTDLEAGPVTQELDVTLDAGDYEFVCDIHPNMVGTLTMAEADPADP
jgi:plastocyanin